MSRRIKRQLPLALIWKIFKSYTTSR